MEYKRANRMVAVFYFLFARKKYLSLAADHGMAVNLEADDLRRAYENGTFPSEEQIAHAEKTIKKFTDHIQRKLIKSFLWIVLASVIALIIGLALGEIHPSFSFKYSSGLTFMGTALASWATLFELGGDIATMSGEALHEIIHPVIFQILFIPGVLLMLIGVILMRAHNNGIKIGRSLRRAVYANRSGCRKTLNSLFIC